MKRYINFVLRKLELVEMMTIKPETVLIGARHDAFTYFNADFEREVQQKLNEIGFSFSRTSAICFALAELYKFGVSELLPSLTVGAHLPKAAYWIIQACDCGNRHAFEFLNRLVPEFFIEGIRPSMMVDLVTKALEEQVRLVPPGTSIEERKRGEVIQNFVADSLICSDWALSDRDALLNKMWKQYQDLCAKENGHCPISKY